MPTSVCNVRPNVRVAGEGTGTPVTNAGQHDAGRVARVDNVMLAFCKMMLNLFSVGLDDNLSKSLISEQAPGL